jgi:hypothetical protein
MSDKQWKRIEPYVPTHVRGKERVDDRHVISGHPACIEKRLPLRTSRHVLTTASQAFTIATNLPNIEKKTTTAIARGMWNGEATLLRNLLILQ